MGGNVRGCKVTHLHLAVDLLTLLFFSSLAVSAFGGQLDDAIVTYPRGGSKVSYESMKTLAEQGLPPAQYTFGILYEVGHEIPQDYAEAAKWYRKAAERGDRYAQTSLGVFYNKGQGVPQDYSEAAKWYRSAAEQGDTFAQTNLGILYAKGQGVQQNYIFAHMWFDLVASAKVTVPQLREKAAKNRDIIASEMTPAQIAEAQRLAREWKAKEEVR